VDRVIGAVAGLLVLVVILPTIAAASQSTIPTLVGLLVVLALLRALAPQGRR
jgi:uncharacterized membrane protein